MDDLQNHYYGNIVRGLFFAAGLVMLISLPTYNSALPVPLYVSILAILTIGLIAGLTNPKHLWAAKINVAVAVIGLAVFEYYAVGYYPNPVDADLFWINQFLALDFFVALYYSTKTLRAMLINKQ